MNKEETQILLKDLASIDGQKIIGLEVDEEDDVLLIHFDQHVLIVNVDGLELCKIRYVCDLVEESECLKE
jgi:hypothetical protein